MSPQRQENRLQMHDRKAMLLNSQAVDKQQSDNNWSRAALSLGSRFVIKAGHGD
jgi:hypothetical protein